MDLNTLKKLFQISGELLAQLCRRVQNPGGKDALAEGKWGMTACKNSRVFVYHFMNDLLYPV